MASSSWRVLTGADSKSYVSLSGLEGVLKSIRDHGMPKSTDRRGIKRAMDKEMPPDMFTTVTLHMVDGTEAQFPAIHQSLVTGSATSRNNKSVILRIFVDQQLSELNSCQSTIIHIK